MSLNLIKMVIHDLMGTLVWSPRL